MNMENAKMWLQKAIDRHERHMMGIEPTEGEMGDMSQRLMMEEMRFSLKAMNSTDDITPTKWYKDNMDKIKMKKM
jgi:aldehyde:ferredoxin oxidoreductase